MDRAKEYQLEAAVADILNRMIGAPVSEVKDEFTRLLFFSGLSYGWGGGSSPVNSRGWHDHNVGPILFSIHATDGIYDDFVWANFNDWKTK